uniref:Acyl-CoA thioester hydrolase/bile acid-CoA amino acid N-acetyltransferase domain-containing protein n=1 Tax=Cyprinodon variegatus TaxID=28743 RepID=A0A3Q2D7Q3_CYPVA
SPEGLSLSPTPTECHSGSLSKTVNSTLLQSIKGVAFKASALYKADKRGQVDLLSSGSLGGSYTGMEPMGFFLEGHPKGWFISPMLMVLEALSGETDELLTSENNERGYLIGVLLLHCLHETDVLHFFSFRRFPGIMDRASLLAGKGLIFLALAFCRYKDLPNNPQNLDLEYFDEALSNIPDESSRGYYLHLSVIQLRLPGNRRVGHRRSPRSQLAGARLYRLTAQEEKIAVYDQEACRANSVRAGERRHWLTGVYAGNMMKKQSFYS